MGKDLAEERDTVRAMLVRAYDDARSIQRMSSSLTAGESPFMAGWKQSTTTHLVQQLQSAAHQLALHLGAAADGDQGFR